jgi:hypothetical protein
MSDYKEPSLIKGYAVLGAITLTVVLALIKSYEYIGDIISYIR